LTGGIGGVELDLSGAAVDFEGEGHGRAAITCCGKALRESKTIPQRLKPN
jgi:hypothetical protein